MFIAFLPSLSSLSSLLNQLLPLVQKPGSLPSSWGVANRNSSRPKGKISVDYKEKAGLMFEV